MSDCCCHPSSGELERRCPECGSVCMSVSMTTLYHQVRFPLNQALVLDSYYFCAAKKCPIAYFSGSGNSVPKQQLISYQAMQDDTLCFCFDIDADQYSSALKATGASSIKAFIVQRTKAGECACEARNPSGRCCLANFKHFEKT